MPPTSSCSLSPVPLTLILASASPRRRELLAALGVPFAVRAVDVPEPLFEGVSASQQATALAADKARAAARPGGAALVLGADTIVVVDGRPLGKPADADEARKMLHALRGRSHEVVTGVAVVAEGSVELTDSAATLVHMRAYTDAEIEDYIAGGDPFDKAGAYAIQHAGFAPVERIEGCYCNVVGLPLWTVCRLLGRAAPRLALRPPSEVYERCKGCALKEAGPPITGYRDRRR